MYLEVDQLALVAQTGAIFAWLNLNNLTSLPKP